MPNTKDIINNLTVKQKISLLTSGRTDLPKPEQQQGLPSVVAADLQKLNSTDFAYPSFYSIANSWNTDLIFKLSAQLCFSRSEDINAVVTPDLSVKTSVYGNGMTEDAHLSASLASAYAKGIAATKALPILAGCAIDDSDAEHMDIYPDKDVVRDYIVKPYKTALGECGCGAVLASDKQLKKYYKDVNTNIVGAFLHDKSYLGLRAARIIDTDLTAAHLLAGFTMSISGNTVPLEDAYNDYILSKGQYQSGRLTAAEFDAECASGKLLSDELLDRSVERLLNVVAGRNENSTVALDKIVVGNAAELSLKASEQSLVLLKNTDKALPLAGGTRVAAVDCGCPYLSKSFAAAASKKNLPFVFSGCINSRDIPDTTGYADDKQDAFIKQAVNLANSSDTVVVFLGGGQSGSAGLSAIADQTTPAELINTAPVSDEILTDPTDLSDLNGSGTSTCVQPPDDSALFAPLNKDFINLSAHQLSLLEALAKTGKKIVAVLENDRPVNTYFDHSCHAFIFMPAGGTYGGQALLNVLTGDTDPSGRLAYTLYDDDRELKNLKQQKDLGKIKVGAFFGYRYYNTAGKDAKYPFGFGLSYTDFDYSSVRITQNEISFVVKNIGKRAGYETAQVYIGKPNSRLPRPQKQLMGFQKIHLNAGESIRISIPFNPANLQICDSDGEFKTEGGQYTVYIGADVSDIRLKKNIDINGSEIVGKKENLANYIYDSANIVTGGYTVSAIAAGKQKIRRLNISAIAILLIVAAYDLIMGMNSQFASEFWLFVLLPNILVPVAVVMIIVSGKTRKRLRTEQEAQPENEIYLRDEPSLEMLFFEEFLAENARTKENTVIAAENAPENISEFTYINNSLLNSDDAVTIGSNPALDGMTINKLASQLEAFIAGHGIIMPPRTVRTILSAMTCFKTITLIHEDINALKMLINRLGGFFESAVVFDAELRLLNINFMVVPPAEISKDTAVINVKLRRSEPSAAQFAVPLLTKNQFEQLVSGCENNFLLAENLWKKLDMLEEYVSTHTSYRIDNKTWRSIEKYTSVYIACDGEEAQALDDAIAAKILPQILPLLRANPISGEDSLSQTIEKILGEGCADACLSTINHY